MTPYVPLFIFSFYLIFYLNNVEVSNLTEQIPKTLSFSNVLLCEIEQYDQSYSRASFGGGTNSYHSFTQIHEKSSVPYLIIWKISEYFKSIEREELIRALA